MKRKTKWKRVKDHTAPPWQTIPMESIVALMVGWEQLKVFREEIKTRPAAQADLNSIIACNPILERGLPQLDAIIPEAKMRAEAWLKSPGSIPGRLVEGDGVTAFLAIVRIWETYLAISERSEKPNDVSRWIACLPSEARRLVFRLKKQINRPEI